MQDYFAKRKEEKFIREVVNILSGKQSKALIKLEAVPCHFDPRFMHLGIEIISEIHIDVHQHVCFKSDSNGVIYQTKSDWQKDDYRWIQSASEGPKRYASILDNACFHWTNNLGRGNCDESLWRSLYPGIPFIGDETPIPSSFTPPPVKAQYTYILQLFDEGILSYRTFENYIDRLEVSYKGVGRIDRFKERQKLIGFFDEQRKVDHAVYEKLSADSDLFDRVQTEPGLIEKINEEEWALVADPDVNLQRKMEMKLESRIRENPELRKRMMVEPDLFDQFIIDACLKVKDSPEYKEGLRLIDFVRDFKNKNES